MANKQSIANIICLSRDLSQDEIYHQLLRINIQALDKLIIDDDRDWNTWRFLVTNYQSSIEDLKQNARVWKATFEEEDLKAGISITFLMNLPLNWFNTLKSTLYMMEEDLIENSPDGIFNLWDLFFEIDEQRAITYSKNLNLMSIYHGN